MLKKHKLSRFDPIVVVGFSFRLLSDLSFGFLTWLPWSSLHLLSSFWVNIDCMEKKSGGQNFMSPWTQLWMVVRRCNVMSFFSSNSFFTVKFLIGLYCIWTIGRYDLSILFQIFQFHFNWGKLSTQHMSTEWGFYRILWQRDVTDEANEKRDLSVVKPRERVRERVGHLKVIYRL